MLGDAGSVASLAGVVVFLIGLGFALWQLRKLRGETRAALEASEATRRAMGREIASAELTRLGERIEGLKTLHRRGNRDQCLAAYPEIRELFLEIRRRHPGLSGLERETILRAIGRISDMETTVEALHGDIPSEIIGEFNLGLTGIQTTLLPQLEDQLQQLI